MGFQSGLQQEYSTGRAFISSFALWSYFTPQAFSHTVWSRGKGEVSENCYSLRDTQQCSAQRSNV